MLNGASACSVNGDSAYHDSYKTQPWIVNQTDPFFHMNK